MPLLDLPHTSPALRALTLATLLACAVSQAGCRDAGTPPTPAVAVAPASAAQRAPSAPAAVATAPSKQQAMERLMALPELKAWSAYIARTSGDKAHGGLLDDGVATVNGKPYWQFGFVENSSDAAHRWQSFLVGQDDGDILVADDASDTNLTLAQWRKDKNPMQRVAAAP
jgi:hypothetical protein